MNTKERVKRYAKMFGMEDENLNEDILADEVDMNESYDYDGDPFKIGIISEPDEYGNPVEDLKDSLAKDDAKAVNLVEMTAGHMNNYYRDMDKIKESGIIENTGNFTSSSLMTRFVDPAVEIVSKCYAKDEVATKIEELGNMLQDRGLMTRLAGNECHPFIYEGLQVVYYLALTGALGMVGPSLKLGGTLEETAKYIKFESFLNVIEMLLAIDEVRGSFGNKIYYMDKTVDIQNNDEAVMYVEIPAVADERDGSIVPTPAGESIANLIEIRNNGALMDFTTIMKVLEKAAAIAVRVDMNEMMDKALSTAVEILNLDSTTEDGEDKFEELVDVSRNEIISAIDGCSCGDDEDEPEEPELDNSEDEDDEDDEDGKKDDDLEDDVKEVTEEAGTESLATAASALWRSIRSISPTSAGSIFSRFKMGALVATGLVVTTFAIKGLVSMIKTKLKSSKLAEIRNTNIANAIHIETENEAAKLYDDVTKAFKEVEKKHKEFIITNYPLLASIIMLINGKTPYVDFEHNNDKSIWLAEFNSYEADPDQGCRLYFTTLDAFPDEYQFRQVEKYIKIVKVEDKGEQAYGVTNTMTGEVILIKNAGHIVDKLEAAANDDTELDPDDIVIEIFNMLDGITMLLAEEIEKIYGKDKCKGMIEIAGDGDLGSPLLGSLEIFRKSAFEKPEETSAE